MVIGSITRLSTINHQHSGQQPNDPIPLGIAIGWLIKMDACWI